MPVAPVGPVAALLAVLLLAAPSAAPAYGVAGEPAMAVKPAARPMDPTLWVALRPVAPRTTGLTQFERLAERALEIEAPAVADGHSRDLTSSSASALGFAMAPRTGSPVVPGVTVLALGLALATIALVGLVTPALRPSVATRHGRDQAT